MTFKLSDTEYRWLSDNEIADEQINSCARLLARFDAADVAAVVLGGAL